MAAEAYSHVAQFYADKLKAHQSSNNDREQQLLEKVLKLTEPVTICLSAMITHMTELLRKWVGRPLLDKARLEERVAAVEELKENAQSTKVDRIRAVLRNTKSDLERSLIRIYYGKCTRPELLTVLQTLQRIANEFAHVKTPSDAGFSSPLISSALATLPTITDVVIQILEKINPEAARQDDKYAFFREAEETESIGDHKLGIAAVEQELNAHRTVAAAKLSKKSPITYVTVAGIEYLIEVPNTDLKHVPASWTKISGTKKLSRFHTPEVVRMLRERDQHKESLSSACDVAFAALLAHISTHYALLRDTFRAGLSSFSRDRGFAPGVL
ncbi:hypothetical protein CJF30_00002522 [Rutstroemia sp. NJR-2017a BBW]|nr:hypothetical protein CJF30_00002522 [Rutstroemia sp. NJR-2017a BBW]